MRMLGIDFNSAKNGRIIFIGNSSSFQMNTLYDNAAFGEGKGFEPGSFPIHAENVHDYTIFYFF